MPLGQDIRWKVFQEKAKAAGLARKTVKAILDDLIADGLVVKRHVKALPPETYYKRVVDVIT